jgi:periplasmic mercuric ion binding protein
MKTKFILIILFFSLATAELHAQSKTTRANIKVFGNCAMCKNRIETALDHPGIKFAEWNTETKDLEVVFNNRKISEKEIHDLIAKAGHDTDSLKASDEVYAKLPFCCLYRDHDHSNIKDEPHKGH